MSNIPEDLKYTKTHEWVKQDADGLLVVGISDHAQGLLGDMVFIELPEVGTSYNSGDDCAVIESVKAASDVYCPVSGEVVEINEAVVFPLMDSKWGEIVAASVVLISDSVELTYDELKSFLEGKISKFKIPKKIFFEKELSKTELGKVERDKLIKNYML